MPVQTPCVSIRAGCFRQTSLRVKTHLPTCGDRVAPELTAKPEALGSSPSGSSEGPGLAGSSAGGLVSMDISGTGHSLGRPEGWVGEGRRCKSRRIAESGAPFSSNSRGNLRPLPEMTDRPGHAQHLSPEPLATHFPVPVPSSAVSGRGRVILGSAWSTIQFCVPQTPLLLPLREEPARRQRPVCQANSGRGRYTQT